MDTAHAFVALGGDTGNSVPKTVTPAEILVLQRLHGADAVHDILPGPSVDRSKKAELARLAAIYQGRDDDGKRHIEVMYPSATLLPDTLADIDLPENLFRATERARPVRTAEVALDQTHGRPGAEAREVGWSNTGFQPIRVPADPVDQPEFVGGMVDPRSQHQNDEPPGVAINAADDGDLGKLKARAEEQGTGPFEPANSQTGARSVADAGLPGSGEKPADVRHAEVTPGAGNALFE